jgi:glutathione S-transferase
MVPLAPNPTKVMLYIAEREALGCRLGIEQIVVNILKGRHREPEHLARDLERVVELHIALPMGGYVHAKKSPLGLPPDPALAQSIEDKLQAPLNHLESLLSDGRNLLLGDRPSLADCTFASALQFLRFIQADLIGDRPKLRAWDEHYRQRPAAKAVLKW